MTIELKKSNYGADLIIEADNVKIVEDVDDPIWNKHPDGSHYIEERSIKTEYIDMFNSVLDDLIYYYKGEYNSKILIENLFDKLSPVNQAELLLKLNKDYEDLLPE